MYRFLIVVSALLFLPITLRSQGASSYWYFGQKAGLRFENNVPFADTNSQLNTIEGVATLSDEHGNLLFYSDGDSVWNRNHQPMPNGFDLGGHASSTQSVVFWPMPLDSNKYYAFTVDGAIAQHGLSYSIIDLTLDNGLGDVIPGQKNIMLEDSVSEKLAIVENCDRTGAWVLVQKLNQPIYLAFEITSSGITAPIQSFGLEEFNVSAPQGYLKVSPNKNVVAVCHEFLDMIELFNFNSFTGELSNPILIPFDSTITANKPYGVEFSPNSQVLYSTNRLSYANPGYITQFDLSSFDSLSIVASKKIISDSLKTASLQLANNGKIYITGDSFIHVINSPNDTGYLCDVQGNAVFLENRKAYQGLPFFEPSQFNLPLTQDTVCLGESYQFICLDSCANSVLWTFGDGDSSTQLNPVHLFADTGTMNIQLIVQYPNEIDTFTASIYIVGGVSLTHTPPDTIFSCDSVFTIEAYGHGVNYLWSSGITNQEIGLLSDSLYSVSVFNSCDTIDLSFYFSRLDSALISHLRDTLVCAPLGLSISVPDSANTWLWSDGDTTSNIKTFQQDTGSVTVWLEASNSCGTVTDTATVTFIPSPNTDWFTDSILCGLEAPIIAAPTSNWMQFVLQNPTMDTLNPWLISDAGHHLLTAFNECDTVQKTAYLSPNQLIDASLPPQVALCPGEEVVLDASWPNATYVWSVNNVVDTSLIDSVVTRFYPEETEVVEVEVTSPPCVKRLQTIVSPLVADSCAPCAFEVPNVFSPNGDGINDVLHISNACSYQEFNFFIYNRWGQLVHTSNQAIPTWDGSIQGAPAAEGAYFIVVEYTDEKGVVASVRNALSLLR